MTSSPPPLATTAEGNMRSLFSEERMTVCVMWSMCLFNFRPNATSQTFASSVFLSFPGAVFRSPPLQERTRSHLPTGTFVDTCSWCSFCSWELCTVPTPPVSTQRFNSPAEARTAVLVHLNQQEQDKVETRIKFKGIPLFHRSLLWFSFRCFTSRFVYTISGKNKPAHMDAFLTYWSAHMSITSLKQRKFVLVRCQLFYTYFLVVVVQDWRQGRVIWASRAFY
jgi:hypothetical protein